MIKAFTRIFLLFFIVLSLGCSRGPTAYHQQLLVFGTLVDIKLWGVKQKKAEDAVAQLSQDFNYMNHAWHAWHAGPLTRANYFIANNEPFTAPPSILPLIKRGTELSVRSGGLFNPAIGNLMHLWGFESDDPPHGPPPDPKAIQALVDQKPSMTDLTIDGITIKTSNPGVKLDFGAFAKGYAVDRAIDYLRQIGINNAVVNAGGDLRAIGSHGDRPWRVGIQHPRTEGVLASVEAKPDESIFTSGDYERYFDWNGKRYAHIIDPRTGYPAHGLTSVTVFTVKGDLADAAATALFVAGPKVKDWLPVARAMGINGAMLVDTQGNVQMTPGIRDRIHFEVSPPPPVQISEPLH